MQEWWKDGDWNNILKMQNINKMIVKAQKNISQELVWKCAQRTLPALQITMNKQSEATAILLTHSKI